MSTTPDVLLSRLAYCKLVLHAVKYPHAAVNGVLIGQKNKSASGGYLITDAVPLLHQCCSLAAPVEAALCQIDFACQSRSPPALIVGIYTANELLFDSSLDLFTSRLGERIQSHFSDAVLLKMENKCLGAAGDTPCFAALTYNADSKSWKNRDKSKLSIDSEEQTLAAASTAIELGLYRDLVDFDNHLDKPALDYWNDTLNARILALST